ncbi:glycine cleavage system protein GcvH [Paraflavitalea pollutisoli]|uniref:glycine cleavage system protein GcvH n=1 Tax=Paraflavitalea pollutisoli TaxID=3034143 RepID=UPI0023EBEA1A|nr:glycine cleavage system protein GcvH [Paraflavitalea sp. H1-2-19X]
METIQRKYSPEHTWIEVNGNMGTIGISEFAQSELGEIVYIDLPMVGLTFQQNTVFGSIEALKTVSDLFTPVSGKVVEINGVLKNEPTLVNTAPFSDGWLIKVELLDMAQLGNLLFEADYNNRNQ